MGNGKSSYRCFLSSDETAFNAVLAEFSPMATSGAGNIFIGSVLRKANIMVDTRGACAAAVTKVEMSDAAGVPSNQYRVTLDRPFVCLVLDAKTSLPLFIDTVLSINN